MTRRLYQIVLLWMLCGLLAACGEEGTAPRGGGGPTAQSARGLPEEWKLPTNPDHRFGDAGLERVSEPRAEDYPQQDEWAKAGVSGGLVTGDGKPVAEVAAGGEIQAAINKADAGVIALAAGEYTIKAPLRLKSGIILRGHADGTTIRYNSPTAVSMTGLNSAGLEQVRLVYTDPEGHAKSNPLPAKVYANAPGFDPDQDAQPAVLIRDSSDCWLSDVRIEDALALPLVVEGSKHCTIRGLEVEGVLNRGYGAGSIVLGESSHLLLTGLKLRDLRTIRVRGPVGWTVFRGMVSGCGFYFAEADHIRGLLIEDCHFLFQPGHPFDPFVKDAMPMGPDSLITNCTVYHHGTDSVTGVLFKPRQPFSINPYASRVSLNAVTGAMESNRLVSRYTRMVELSAGPGGRQPEVIAAQWDAAPEGIPVRQLRNKGLADEWVWTTSVGSEALEVPIAEVLSPPLKPGEKRTIAGASVDVAAMPERDEREVSESEAANRQQMVGRWGMHAMPPAGRAVQLIERVGGDWKGGLVMQQVVHIPGEPVVAVQLTPVSCEAKLYINGTAIEEKRPYRLEPGYHVITGMAKMHRALGLETQASLGIRFELQLEAGRKLTEREVREPENGFLYPFVCADPLGDDRAGVEAWRGFFLKLRAFPFENRIAETKAFIEAHEGEHVAWVAERVLEVLENAPFDEDAKLSPEQWGALADYYRREGMPERTWAIGRTHKFPTYRRYYPEMEVK